MSTIAIDALNRRYLLDYSSEAALVLERMEPSESAQLLGRYPLTVLLSVWPYFTPDAGERVFGLLPEKLARGLLTELEPALSTALLRRFEPDRRIRYLEILTEEVRRELETLLHYPVDSAGHMMDPRVMGFRSSHTVREAEDRLRANRPRTQREIYVVDDAGRLESRVELQALAVADPVQPLASITRPLLAAVQGFAPREEVVEKLEQHKLTSLPVTDLDGRLIGVIHHEGLVTALAQEASMDIQTMVGVSKDERALSPSSFAVRKRLGWLHVNLLTAFLAASVVGLFESTIAKFTALAVLLPIVAGQSGNAGAQALAVTMRGLALREIGMRHWARVVTKETLTGFVNGIAIALTTGIGVWVWSQSTGLALVIGSSMVLAMVAAGLSGALIPILLERFGQDPAQSSSIILTTVTDVVGFFSFLGIATAFSGFL